MEDRVAIKLIVLAFFGLLSGGCGLGSSLENTANQADIAGSHELSDGTRRFSFATNSSVLPEVAETVESLPCPIPQGTSFNPTQTSFAHARNGTHTILYVVFHRNDAERLAVIRLDNATCSNNGLYDSRLNELDPAHAPLPAFLRNEIDLILENLRQHSRR